MKIIVTPFCRIAIVGITVILFVFNSHGQTNLLNRPESVIYDSLYNRYLVSNWANGSIVQIDSDGVQSYFTTGHGSINGVWIAESIVFAGCSTRVKGFDLTDSSMVMNLAIPGALNINDITSDNNGNIYLTDFDARKIYKVNIQSQAYSTIVSGLARSPNGIIYEESVNRLLLCSFGSNVPILSYDLDDSTLTTIAYTTLGNCDGLAKDNFGNYYVSSWYTNSVYKFDPDFNNPPELFYTNAGGCADISYNSIKDEIDVAVMNYNLVKFLPVNPVSVGEENTEPLQNFNLNQNYPNPFNPGTSISYTIAELSHVSLKVYDIAGNEIESLVDDEKLPGNYVVEFEGLELSSGVYFYEFRTGEYVESKKMMLIK